MQPEYYGYQAPTSQSPFAKRSTKLGILAIVVLLILVIAIGAVSALSGTSSSPDKLMSSIFSTQNSSSSYKMLGEQITNGKTTEAWEKQINTYRQNFSGYTKATVSEDKDEAGEVTAEVYLYELSNKDQADKSLSTATVVVKPNEKGKKSISEFTITTINL